MPDDRIQAIHHFKKGFEAHQVDLSNWVKEVSKRSNKDKGTLQ